MPSKEKPPIGVVPLKEHNRLRSLELLGAMVRYVEVGKCIPRDWIQELEEFQACPKRNRRSRNDDDG